MEHGNVQNHVDASIWRGRLDLGGTTVRLTLLIGLAALWLTLAKLILAQI